MAFVNDNEVKEILRERWIIWKCDSRSRILVSVIVLVIIRVLNILTFEKREQALDGGDDHVGILWDCLTLKPINGEDGIECIAVLREFEFAEFVLGLLAQIIAVYKEKDSPHRCVGEETI